MKKSTLILLFVVLFAAVLVLYVVTFSCKSKTSGCASEQPQTCNMEQGCMKLPIAYVNVDSLLLNYELSQELNEQLLRKRENSQANYNQKARQFENEVAEFQRKLQNNAFLSEQRAQSEQQRLAQKQQDLQALDQRLSTELANELQAMNERLRDSIYNYLGIYNQAKGYQLIFSNQGNDNIMIGDVAYDITEEVLEGLNKRYNPASAKK